MNTPALQSQYADPLPTTTASRLLDALPVHIADTLAAYSLLGAQQTAPEFLLPTLQAFVAALTTAPPPPAQTRAAADACEICERSWIPLTYHHLIPRGVHAKVLKRAWHPEDQLQNVAWLCRACHSFVHRIAGLEELAREWYTVERLLEREDVRAFASWVGKVRWKVR